MKPQCTKGKQRRISRWEQEPVAEAAQRRLDENPGAMRARRETAEHPFGTLKARMGATHLPPPALLLALKPPPYGSKTPSGWPKARKKRIFRKSLGTGSFPNTGLTFSRGLDPERRSASS
jgi:hypothetical protein